MSLALFSGEEKKIDLMLITKFYTNFSQQRAENNIRILLSCESQMPDQFYSEISWGIFGFSKNHKEEQIVSFGLKHFNTVVLP